MTLDSNCHHCGQEIRLVYGFQIWKHRKDLADIPVWRCVKCEARVGCHPGTLKPLGKVATQEERSARMKAHAAFDPLWKSGKMSRSAAYSWLAKGLGLPKKRTHISLFGVLNCTRVVELVKSLEAPREMESHGRKETALEQAL